MPVRTKRGKIRLGWFNAEYFGYGVCIPWSKTPDTPIVLAEPEQPEEIDGECDDLVCPLENDNYSMPSIVDIALRTADDNGPVAWLICTKPNRSNSHKMAITTDVNGCTTKTIIFSYE